MNGHSGADGLVWRGKELSNETTMTANVWLSHLLWMHDSLFSFFLSLYLLLSPCFVWATRALYSFILHKLGEAIYQKSSKNYIPQCLTKSLSSSKQQCACMIIMTFFCRSRRQWHLFSLLSFYIQRPGTSIWMISGCRYIVGCFPQWGKIPQLKTMKMVL